MSKLPNHSIWARATTSAASSNRASSLLTSKSHSTSQHRHGSRSAPRQNARQDSATSPAALDPQVMAAMGAVSAPYCGPQPAAVVEAYETHHNLVAQQEGAAAAVGPSPAYTFPSLSAFSSNFLISNTALRVATSSSSVASTSQRLLHQRAHAHGGLTRDDIALARRMIADRTAVQDRRIHVGDATSLDVSRAELEGLQSLDRHTLSAKETQVMESLDRWLGEVDIAKPHGKSRRRHSARSAGAKAVRSTHDIQQDASSSRTAADQSPLHSRSPSPESSYRSAHVDRQHPASGNAQDTQAGMVVAAATTTSDVSTHVGAQARPSYIAATASASAPAGSTSSMPPPASASAGSTDHWARTFNIPRSSKRHDFMFEHGAYGIPKRHPLSSIRKAAPSSSSQPQSSERASPSRNVVPSSKVRAATDMLSAAADFLTGPQGGSARSGGEYYPRKGSDALQAALAGGSTAEGYELRQSTRPGGTDTDPARSGVHRMAIRGSDGRIIKDRLRSVQVGEDAYFLRPDSLGVADGVGGWASRPGADPALFSRLLMHFCAVELSRYDGLSASELAADNGSLLKAWASVDPVEVMHRAWERCVRASRREGILGSSTALLGILRGDELRIANMGDCVIMIIRGGEMMFRSTEQQHSFNFPVQLGMMGDTTDTIKKHVMTAQKHSRAVGEGELASGGLEDYDKVEDLSGGGKPDKADRNGTTPPVRPDRDGQDDDGDDAVEPDWDEPRRDAGRWTVRVEAGDIIVVGSDGLMDNLFDEDIIEEVVRFLPQQRSAKDDEGGSSKVDSSSFSPQLVSEALCSRAKAVSEDSRAISSPFQQRAMEEGLNYVGGKHDDISVLVCLVGERDEGGFEVESSSSASASSAASATPSETSSGNVSDAESSASSTEAARRTAGGKA